MKKLAIVFAASAAALLGGSAANAADTTVKAKGRDRHKPVINRLQLAPSLLSPLWYRHYRPYYRSYGYAPRPYYGYGGGYGGPYYGGGYGYGGPSVSFSFGGGGYRGW